MRVRPLIGRKPWFGPRRFGWGLSPISIEGWLVTAAAVAAQAWTRRRLGWGRRRRTTIALAVLLVMALKGTSPGGARDRKTLRAASLENR
ncbi:MAG: hypothetical protein ACREN7_10685 [Candidatus Dormibacteria bacterium]